MNEIVYNFIGMDDAVVMRVVQADNDSAVGFSVEDNVIRIWKSGPTGEETTIIPIGRLIELRHVLR